MEETMYNIGKIVNTQGLQGDVKVVRITDFEERFAIGNKVHAHLNEQMMTFKIDGHRIHKGFDILHFSGYDTIDDVEFLKGTPLVITTSQLTALDENEYYFHEIIGCAVWTITGEKLGTITEILTPGANDVWVVRQETGQDLLIPYIGDVVKHVNVTDGMVTIELMEGLLD